jgi:LTXXQ motif family protein
VFWPYAYDDVFDDVLWGYGLGSPFWDYGYDDIYGGVFLPFGDNDLVGHLPSEQPQGTASAPAGRAENRQAGRSSLISKMCGDDSKVSAGWPIDRIEQGVSPTAEQRAALDEFADATIQAAQMIKDACPIDVVFTPSGRLEAMQKRIEGMVQAVTMVGPPLGRFYNSLADEQKARLNAANEQGERNRGSTAGCNAAGNAARWPADQVEKAVQPSPEQQSKLDALKKAMLAASDDLADACPSSLPATPPARLKAISRRLEIMLKAVKNIRPVLDRFYASLSDEQRAQFNAIRPQRIGRR